MSVDETMVKPGNESMFLNIMFHEPMVRFQLESKLELLLFTGFTVVPQLWNQIL